MHRDSTRNELAEATWGKLAPRQLYVENPLPERHYEDVAVAGRHLLAVDGIAYCSVPVYAYVMRKEPVTHRQQADLRQLEDFVWAMDQLLGPLEDAYPQYENAFAYKLALECARAHSIASIIGSSGKAQARKLDATLLENIALALKRLKGDGRAPRSQLLRFSLLCKSPFLYDAVYAIYEDVARVK